MVQSCHEGTVSKPNRSDTVQLRAASSLCATGSNRLSRRALHGTRQGVSMQQA